MPEFRDPAEAGELRFYYRDWKPTLLGRINSRLWAWATSLGLWRNILITLQVRSRESGHLISHVLAPVHIGQVMYLVSMLGEGSGWVQDVHATDGYAFLKQFRAMPVRLVELPVTERGAVLQAWAQVAISGRRHFPVPPNAPLADFERIAEDFPVFRVDHA